MGKHFEESPPRASRVSEKNKVTDFTLKVTEHIVLTVAIVSQENAKLVKYTLKGYKYIRGGLKAEKMRFSTGTEVVYTLGFSIPAPLMRRVVRLGNA